MRKFKINIIVCSLVLLSCSKKANNPDTTPPASTHTTGMGGMRNWHGHHYYTASGPNFPTPIYEDWSLPDTSFAIIVINDHTVVSMADTFKYHSSDSVIQIHFFGMAKFNYLYGRGRGEGLAYYYAIDSIVYFKSQNVHGTTDMWVWDNRYYTY